MTFTGIFRMLPDEVSRSHGRLIRDRLLPVFLSNFLLDFLPEMSVIKSLTLLDCVHDTPDLLADL